MIPEHKYADYYWITLKGFSTSEWENFKKEMCNFPKAYTYDGLDDEEMTVCFKFSRHIPKNSLEVMKCKKQNTRVKKDVLKAISNNLRGKVYFNVSKGILKKL